jgi:tape measure domain-containing protein
MADPKIKYDIEAAVSGSADVIALANHVEKLAGSLEGDLKANALAAADSLRELGRQDAVLSQFATLRNSVQQTATQLTAAQKASAALGFEISASAAPTAKQAGQLQKLKDTAKSLEIQLGLETVALQRLNSNLSASGISASNFVNEQVRVKNALAGATVEANKVAVAFKAAEANAKTTATTLKAVSTESSGLSGIFSGLGRAIVSAFAAREFVTAAAQMEQLQSGLQAVFGSAGQAKTEMDFVRTAAVRSGVDVAAAAKAYLGLAAATKGTAVEGEPTRQVFEAVSSAMAKAGKSSAETENALRALSQIASKGVVSMEELRGQLGEALPGALQAVSNGLGITTQDLIKLVENGQIAAQDLFPALTKGLAELYGGAPGAQTLSQEITNIKNAFVQMASEIGDSGVLTVLKIGAESAQAAISILGASLIDTGKRLGVLAGAVATFDFSNVKEAFIEIEKESRERLVKAAANNTILQLAIKNSGDAAAVAALEIQAAGAKAVVAGTQAAGAAPGYVALASAYGKVREELTGQIVLAEKELESQKAKGQAAIAQAKLLGDEANLRKVIAKAAADEAAATTLLAEQRQIEVNVLIAELANKKELLAQSGKASGERNKEIKELQDLIQKKQVDADKTNAQASAAKAYAQSVGEAVQAAKAQIAAVETLNVKRVSEAQSAVNLLNTQKELASQAYELAKLMGDEAGMRTAKIAQVRIEIELAKAKANAMKVEAEGTIAVAQAKLAELKVSGQLTPLKEAEINAAIKLAQAKIAEAAAFGKSTELLAKQLELLENGTTSMEGFGKASENAAGSQGRFAASADKATIALERQNAEKERAIAAQEKANDLVERAIALENKRLGIDRDKFSVDKDGKRIEVSGITPESAFNEAKNAGLSEKSALSIQQKYAAISNSNDARFGDFQALYREINRLKILEAQLNQQNGTGGAGGSTGTATNTNTASAGAPAVSRESSGRTVNIQIGGGNYPVQTNAQGADNLIKALQLGARNAGR